MCIRDRFPPALPKTVCGKRCKQKLSNQNRNSNNQGIPHHPQIQRSLKEQYKILFWNLYRLSSHKQQRNDCQNDSSHADQLFEKIRISLFHKITHKRSLQIIQILPLDPINDAQKDSQYEKHTPCCSRQFLHIDVYKRQRYPAW